MSEPDGRRRRRWWPAPGPGRAVAVTVAVALATGAAGWVIGDQVKSPATVAASHRPPAATPVTAPVVRRTLEAQVITQSSVGYGQAQPISLVGTVGSTAAGAPATSIITKAPTAGRTIREGDVLLEVSGRPVFALEGSVPMYRTIGPGDTGEDVDQLRSALNRVQGAGLSGTGPFDGAVQAAMKQLYQDRGYPAVAVKGGISVASGEILFFAGLPRHLASVTAAPGSPATGQIATSSSPTVYGYGSVGVDDATLVKVGMAATLWVDGGARLSARIAAIGGGAAAPGAASPSESDSGDGGDAAAGTPVRFTLTDQAKARSVVGQALKTTIGVGGTSGPVLTVPVSALFTQADGSTRVRVLAADATGSVRIVPVQVGLSVDGTVQVTSSHLAVGDRVLVSRQ